MEKLGKPFVWVRLSGSKLICGFLNFSTIIPGLMKALLSVGMLPWARIYKEPRVAGLLPHQAPPELCPLLTDFIFDKQEKGCKIHAFFEKLSQHLGQSILFIWDDLIGSSCGLIFKMLCVWKEGQGAEQTERSMASMADLQRNYPASLARGSSSALGSFFLTHSYQLCLQFCEGPMHLSSPFLFFS